MKGLALYVLAAAVLGGCGIEEGVRRNDDRYLRPGALDLPLTSVFDTYQFRFLDKYRVTHQWPRSAGACKYAKLPTLGVDGGAKGEIWNVSDIYEKDGKTWQISSRPGKPFDFDPYVRSVKVMNPVVYDKETGKRIEGASEEIEAGLRAICFASWYVTSHSMTVRLHKRDVQVWKGLWTTYNAKGKWSQQRIAGNDWSIQEVPENDLSPRALNAAGGWFQSWLLPIGDTGYTIALQLGASQESLQYPEAHARFKAAFRHLIESVRIEPLQ